MLHLKETREAEPPERTVELIAIEKIAPNPSQPRKSFPEEGLDELSRSIQQYGLLQPVLVRENGRGGYELIAGERRMMASLRAGMTHIPALVHPCFEKESAVIAMVENLQRENLHFFEEAEGYQVLLRRHGMTQEELAVKLGKNQSTIANKLRILRLEPRIRAMVLESHLTERHARALLRVHDQAAQEGIISQIVKGSLSVKQSERLIERTLMRRDDAQQRARMIRMLRDHRLFINTLKQALAQLRESGIKAEYEVNEGEHEIMIRVRIPR